MMKKRTFYILLMILLQATTASAQLDSINQLDEVVLSDVRLYTSSEGNRVQVLRDSVLEENSPSLTSVLRFNTPLYFRENGPGMVSSVSFRGTTASQTAVVWNGININSQFTGQTDFNTLLASNYDQIVVRSGGGSVLYGSGAIAGSVHLNNNFRFDQGFRNKIRLEYGSFNTFFGSATSSYSSEATSFQLNVARHSSDNDFEYPGGEQRNSNGDFENTGVTAAVAHLLNDHNRLKFFSNYFYGERGFSGTLTAASKSKYEDVNSRNLLEWQHLGQQYDATLSLAYLDETYRFFENREADRYTFGRAKTGILKYDHSYRIEPEMSLGGIAELEYTLGEGTNVGEQERKTASVGVLFSHDLNRFSYEVSLGAELNDQYKSPLLFSVSTGYELNSNYSLQFNFSRNYRIPTFNDLFWYAGGNSELQPEKSLQAEFGQSLNLTNLEIALTAFVVEIDDLLRWVPNSGGIWKPVNTESVRNYGIEALGEWRKKFGDHQLQFSGTYGFTRSRDEKLEKELIYVPRHKATASVGYGQKRFSAYYQALYNGSVFTSSDNNYLLDAYSISILGVEYDFLKKNRGSIGAEIHNLWNASYQNMPSRPMPGRSYNLSLTFIF